MRKKKKYGVDEVIISILYPPGSFKETFNQICIENNCGIGSSKNIGAKQLTYCGNKVTIGFHS